MVVIKRQRCQQRVACVHSRSRMQGSELAGSREPFPASQGRGIVNKHGGRTSARRQLAHWSRVVLLSWLTFGVAGAQQLTDELYTTDEFSAAPTVNQADAAAPSDFQVSTPPPDEAPWWETQVPSPQRNAPQTMNVSLESLLVGALNHSAQLKVYADLPLIREWSIAEADAAFDWTSFIESRWDNTSMPVGNSLTTGGPGRFRDHNLTHSFGGRRRNTYGGEFEISQKFGLQNNNSLFFIPKDQGTTRLSLNYTQPLLRGAGKVYNSSLTILAKIDTESAQDDFSRQLQQHLVDVTEAYWDLYLTRSLLLQKRRLLSRAEEIYAELDSRREIDAHRSQIVRARAAVESRRADIVRANSNVRNTEARIRALVNDPNLGSLERIELLPTDAPAAHAVPIDLQESLTVAMQLRPEITQAMRQIRAAGVRMKMSQNELLPLLNVVLETYVSGLRGDYDVGQSFVDQFQRGEPSYAVGLQLEAPIGNRAAQARMQRRRLEMRRLQHQFRSSVEALKLEVQIAVNNVVTAYDEMSAKHLAMVASADAVDYVLSRWKELPAENGSSSLMLEDLLEAQERLADAEASLAQSAANYSMAIVAHKKAVGSLLEYEQIGLERACTNQLPEQVMTHPGQARGLPGDNGQETGPAVELPTESSAATRGAGIDDGWENAGAAPVPDSAHRSLHEVSRFRLDSSETAIPPGEQAPLQPTSTVPPAAVTQEAFRQTSPFDVSRRYR